MEGWRSVSARVRCRLPSGKIAKRTPESVDFHTPTSILGVRGTEFVIEVEGMAMNKSPLSLALLALLLGRAPVSASSSCRHLGRLETGAVVVRDQQGELRLDQPYAALKRSLAANRPYQSSPAEVTERFAQALAQPAAPAECLRALFRGRWQRTHSGVAGCLASIRKEIAERPASEVMVIGHTDRVGMPKLNDSLSLTRAEGIRDLLIESGWRWTSWKPSGVASAIPWCRPPTMSMSRRTGASRSTFARAIPAQQQQGQVVRGRVTGLEGPHCIAQQPGCGMEFRAFRGIGALSRRVRPNISRPLVASVTPSRTGRAGRRPATACWPRQTESGRLHRAAAAHCRLGVNAQKFARCGVSPARRGRRRRIRVGRYRHQDADKSRHEKAFAVVAVQFDLDVPARLRPVGGDGGPACRSAFEMAMNRLAGRPCRRRRRLVAQTAGIEHESSRNSRHLQRVPVRAGCPARNALHRRTTAWCRVATCLDAFAASSSPFMRAVSSRLCCNCRSALRRRASAVTRVLPSRGK